MPQRLAAAVLAVAGWVLLAPGAHAAVPPPVAGAALQDRLCERTAASAEPQASATAGCAQAHCSAVGDETLCTCEGPRGHRFERRRGTQVLQRWATEVSAMTGPGAFEVTQTDVDGDGTPEWLVARLQGISNGLGVSRHTLCVLWPGQPKRAPVCRDVSEWGALSVLVHEGGRASCSLMDSAWQSGYEPGRGQGTYAVGRVLRLQGGAWKPVPQRERPAVSRRLLREFEAERETLPLRNAKALWYQHPAAVLAHCPGPLCPLPPDRR